MSARYIYEFPHLHIGGIDRESIESVALKAVRAELHNQLLASAVLENQESLEDFVRDEAESAAMLYSK